MPIRRCAMSAAGRGNVANGDPGNDMPAVMMCLTRLTARSANQANAALQPANLPRRLFHSAGARRNRNAIPVPDAGGRPRLCLRGSKRKVGDYATAALRLCSRQAAAR